MDPADARRSSTACSRRSARPARIGELRYTDEHILPKSATEYFQQNCWVGVSQPGPDDAAARHEIGLDRFMWGSDYPHDEGTYPFTREHLRQLFHDTDPSRAAADCSPATRPSSTTSTSTRSRRSPAQVGPTVAEIAEPLTELPAEPNAALLKAIPSIPS